MASGTPDKVASSRLLTMAFMQRAIAKEGGSMSSPTTLASSKKRKTGSSQSGKTPEQAPPVFDQAALNAAIADEERKRQAALEQRARDLGDSRWVLRDPRNVTGNVMQKPLDVVQVGYSQIDRDDEDSGDDRLARRLHFNTKKASTKKNNSTGQCCNEHNSESDGDCSNDSNSGSSSSGEDQKGHVAKSKVMIPSKRHAELARASMLAEKRRKKDINLNRPTSISATQSRPGPASPNTSNIICYGCGKKGHTKIKCPHPGGFRSV